MLVFDRKLRDELLDTMYRFGLREEADRLYERTEEIAARSELLDAA